MSNIFGILLSDETALKLFNTTNVVGKTIAWDFKDNVNFGGVYKIEGVFKAPPANTTVQFDVLFPFELYAQKHAGGMGDVLDGVGAEVVQVCLQRQARKGQQRREERQYLQSRDDLASGHRLKVRPKTGTR